MHRSSFAGATDQQEYLCHRRLTIRKAIIVSSHVTWEATQVQITVLVGRSGVSWLKAVLCSLYTVRLLDNADVLMPEHTLSGLL